MQTMLLKSQVKSITNLEQEITTQTYSSVNAKLRCRNASSNHAINNNSQEHTSSSFAFVKRYYSKNNDHLI